MSLRSLILTKLEEAAGVYQPNHFLRGNPSGRECLKISAVLGCLSHGNIMLVTYEAV